MFCEHLSEYACQDEDAFTDRESGFMLSGTARRTPA
jgi:hypothetical protein